MRLTAALVVAALMVLGGVAQAALIYTESFETPNIAGDGAIYINGGTDNGTIIPNWYLTSATYRFVGSATQMALFTRGQLVITRSPVTRQQEIRMVSSPQHTHTGRWRVNDESVHENHQSCDHHRGKHGLHAHDCRGDAAGNRLPC